jgi:hypothetical protein
MTRQFAVVNTRFGAPMGRHGSGDIECTLPRSVRLFRVRLDSGGYDDGGAYWGIGLSLWCAMDDDGNRQFVRAPHRTRAALVLGIAAPALKVGLADWSQYACNLLDGRAPLPAGVSRQDVLQWMQDCGAAMGQQRDEVAA